MLILSGFTYLSKNDESITHIKKDDIIIENGKIKGIKGLDGADTVIPFNSNGKCIISGNAASRDVWYDGSQNRWEYCRQYFTITVDFEAKTCTLSLNNADNPIFGSSGLYPAIVTMSSYTFPN